MSEPHVVINGIALTEGQAMALRVAVSSYLAELADRNALGDDEHGRAIAKAYRARLMEVSKIIGG